jgi:diguanylate cyclase (GGDEF)-like protein
VVHEKKLSAVLSEFARTMVTDFPVQDILDRLVERIVQVLPVTSAGVTLIEPGLAPRYIAASDPIALEFEKLQTATRQGPCVLAYHSGEAVSVPHLSTDKRFPAFSHAAADSGLVAVFTFPLNHGAGRLGALDLYRDSVGELDPDDMVAAQTLADVTAAYLINAQAREDDHLAAARFEASALHDPLTGLPNRTLFDERLEHAAQRATRGHTSAAVLFADLDRFKAVNDTYGHQAGDQVLVAVADRLSGLLRPGDTLARVSGDEFVFLCEDLTHARDAEILANRIRSAFLAPFGIDAGELTVTASVGVAFAGPGEDISGHLVVKADTAMYQAKRDGASRGPQALNLRDVSSEHAATGPLEPPHTRSAQPDKSPDRIALPNRRG